MEHVMLAKINTKGVSARECDLRHGEVDRAIEQLRKRLDSLENKLWWTITLLVSNLVGLLVLIVRSMIE